MADNETPPPIVVLSFGKLFSSTFFSSTVSYSFTLRIYSDRSGERGRKREEFVLKEDNDQEKKRRRDGSGFFEEKGHRCWFLGH